MFFKGVIFDPHFSYYQEHRNYSEFIDEIQVLALLEMNKSSPLKEEATYLWIKIIVAQTEEDLELREAPYFRLNKLVYFAPNAKKPEPAEMPDNNYLSKYYPNRKKGDLYLTAIATSIEANSEENAEESISDFSEIEPVFELQEEATRYSKDPKFDTSLSPIKLINSLSLLFDLVKEDNRDQLIKNTNSKQALAMVCFYIPEAVRFKLVQYAVMNMLHESDSLEPNQETRTYWSWKMWNPVITNWSKLSERLDSAGQRGLNPKLLVGIPINIVNRSKSNLPLFNTGPIQNVLGLFASETDKFIEKVQDEVLVDYMVKYISANFDDYSIFSNKVTPHFQNRIKCAIELLQTDAQKLYNEQNYKGALNKYVAALKMSITPLTVQDENRILSLNHFIGVVHIKLKKHHEGIPYLEKSLKLAKMLYGPKHSNTIKVQKNLDLCLEGCNEGNSCTIMPGI